MIKIIDYTENPLTLIGKVASTCWDSTPSPRIGIECIESGHGRVLEYADVTVAITDYSARVIRELYTHHVGVSRLQGSTRYIDMSSFDYYIPPSIENCQASKRVYDECMVNIMKSYTKLKKLDMPKEDSANVLPLGSNTTVVLKINARAILTMAEQRLCTRTLLEYRELMDELLSAVSGISDEWAKIISYAKPKCDALEYCPEQKSCGRYPLREDTERVAVDRD